MVLSMRASGTSSAEKMARARKAGLTAVNMRGTGKRTKPTAGDDLFMLMVMCTMENGKMTRLMGMESMITWMVFATMDTGLKTSNMDMERKLGLIMPISKVSTVKERSTGEVYSHMLTDLSTLVSSLKIIFTVKESSIIQAVANMTANGRITKWTVKESSLGPMEENTRASTLTKKRRDMEYLRGPMVVSTMVVGVTGGSMVLQRIILAVER